MMKKLLIALFTLLSISSFAQKHKVIVQLNSGDTLVWHSTLKNVSNLKTALGADTQVEVVAHGSGIGLLIASKTNQKAAIEELAKSGVLFMACENTIRERKIDKASILSQAGYVKSGVSEVVLKQEEGWSYLKAGF